MSNVNITEVRLLSVPLGNDYIHTLYFANETAQIDYFLSRSVKHYTSLTYQRTDHKIRVPEQYDSLLNCNYVMYKNPAYSNKWFYAFINNMTYVDGGRTDIEIETDVIQTWMFKYTVYPSFIEREHVSSDRIGEHTVPEGLETGEYICNKHTKAGYSTETELNIVIGVTKDPDGKNVKGRLYNNIYSGIHYYAFNNTSAGAEALRTWLDDYAEDGAADAITCMFLAPKRLSEVAENHMIVSGAIVDAQYINGSDSGLSTNTIVDMTDETLQGYSPINKKLLTSPFRYLLVSNNAGCSVPFQFEEFKSDDGSIRAPYFVINGCICPGTSIRMIPLNYKGIGRNDEEGINLGKFPCLNWTSDVYTNWLTQNGLNIGTSIGSSAISAGIGIASAALAPATGGMSLLAGAAALSGGLSGIASTVGEVRAHSMQPPQASGNLNSGDVVTASGNNDFHFYDMSIKAEFARIIDNYFSMFGYKIHRVKQPNVAHRENYWYTKTIDANVIGAIPTDHLNKIKACYNKGITFWKNPEKIGNYTVSNLPIN